MRPPILAHEVPDAEPKPDHAPNVRQFERTAIIIGAGPAGLTAAYELLTRTDIRPIVLEKSEYLGGISRTVVYKGNRIDIGGHRFFSKSQRVMEWWLKFLPLQQTDTAETEITYHGQSTTVCTSSVSRHSESEDSVMLVRKRKSRIYYMRKFFAYPISLSLDTVRKLGVAKTVRIGLSYLRALFFPIRPENNLEQFFINRFGRELYLTFFKSYTEKVWGMTCDSISAEWGAQRVKGLSITKSVLHVLKKLTTRNDDVAQSGVETSLIEQFLYPKFGPGQMWETVASEVRNLGGAIAMNCDVTRIEHDNSGRVLAIIARDKERDTEQRWQGDYFFSTMPVSDLVTAMCPAAPESVHDVAGKLLYRSFVTVGVLCKDLKLREREGGLARDNWIYIQEPDVLVGRIQIFNNWSPALVADPGTVWIGLEYFCNENEGLWNFSDAEMIELARKELVLMRMLDPVNLLDATVIRMPKTYPAYFGSYDRFPEVIAWADRFENLFLIGRNGMHKYNNQDHSMLTAMTAVDNLLSNVRSRDNLWALNTEQDYHEEKPAGTEEPQKAISRSA